MHKQLIQTKLIWLLIFLGPAEGEKLWSGALSITAVQGQTVTIQWIVNLTLADSSKVWTYAKVIQVQEGRTADLFSLQKSGIKTINDPRYQNRASDLNLNVSQIGATVTIKFTLTNLLRWMDEKYYKAMLGFASDSSTFPGATSLVILERPHSSRITASPNQTAYCINDRITITRVSRAHPTAEYSLYRDNDLVQSGVSSGIFVVSTALTDRVYTCVPYNSIGTGQNGTFPVHVKEPPKIIWCQMNDLNTTNNTFVEGTKVTMMCQLSGSEPMDVTWVRINASPPLRWNERNLTFNAIRHEDEGWYRMTVNNGKECNTTASATFHVKVNYKPVGTNISVLPNQSTFCINEQIVITCKTEAKPAPEYSLYQNNQLIQRSSESGSFRMFLLLKGEILFRCIPLNALGSGETKSLRLFVKEPPSIARCKVNNQDQSNITVNVGVKASFECGFSGTRPLNVTWTKEGPPYIRWNQWNLTINPVQRFDSGIYKVTVYNGKECNTAVSRTFNLVVNYMSKIQVVGNNFNVFNQSTTLVNFVILIDAYPDVTLTCQSAQLEEQAILVQRTEKQSTKNQFIVSANTSHVDNDIRLKCTAENKVDYQAIGLLIYKQGVVKIFTGSMKLVDQDWHEDLRDINSEAHKILRTKCMKMLYDVYNYVPYVRKWDVQQFTSGSVVMDFDLHVIADVSDPLLPLRIAVENNGGFVGDLQVDPTSIKKQQDADMEGQKKSNTKDSTNIIIAVFVVIVVFCLLIIVILVVHLLRLKAASKKKGHAYDYPDLPKDGAPLQERRPLPAAPNNGTQGVVQSRDSNYDYCYERPHPSQPSSNQLQTNTGRDNPTLNQPLPENQSQAHDTPPPLVEEKEESNEADEGISQRTKDEGHNGEIKGSLQSPEGGSESHKKYNKLDPSTKIPSRNNRPALEQGEEIQLLSSVNHGYQNPETAKEKSSIACEAPKPLKGNEAKLKKQSSKEYNRLTRPMTQLLEGSRPVSTQGYEIPPSGTVDIEEENQKTTQRSRNSQDNQAFAEKEPQKASQTMVETVEDST